MDPVTMMNDGAPFNLAEIWQYPMNESDMRRGSFGSILTQVMDPNNVPTDSDPTQAQSGGGGSRKRREAVDELAKVVPTTSGNGLRDSKRLKGSGSVEETRDADADAEGEPSSGKTGEQKSQAVEPPKDYIHVRARRGQATDSHSLAERARREKISERMKTLQDLVPGCNKVIGKALVLDEIINYIQSLQCQVEFLSMKLEAVGPDIEAFTPKDYDQQTFDNSGIAFDAQSSGAGYSRGASPEWLHMQVGSSGFR